MAQDSAIEWCDHSFSPWFGCSKITQGCKFCYADTLINKRFGLAEWGPQATRKRAAPTAWALPPRWDRKAQKTGRRPRLFCGHLCDVFEGKSLTRPGEDLPAWRHDLLTLIDQCHNLDWLILTKRPANVLPMIGRAVGGDPSEWLKARPWVWVGTSIEDQAAAALRLPALAAIPARVRFVSIEPLLAPVTMAEALIRGEVDLSIIGGESGHQARLCDLEWIRDLVTEHTAAGVPVYVKQLGDRAVDRGQPYKAGPKGKRFDMWPPELRIRQMPAPMPAHIGPGTI